MFTKILIANRGEIACRIIKTAQRLGIETVAIYSTADRDSLHTALADEAYCIGLPAANLSYLNIEAIMAVARSSGAQAIHPGYGFLSENPHFAKACEAAGIVFIGPSISAMQAMASKQLAKQLLENKNVPLTPGYHGRDQSDACLLAEAQKIGFPVLLKAANGGGGKGMREVHTAADFSEALAGARRESNAYFADEILLIEKLISNPRHVEMQIMADNHGNVVHLFERDCSIQRRHQKIIEEAPAPNLSAQVREKLAQAAIEVARAIDYRGAGTIEFLVDKDEHFYFMEMNTRLQVEHPVTEMITGLDLVEWQLRIAANQPLPCSQDQIHAHGHAIECRVYAEDPHNNFMPSIGQVQFLQEPSGDFVRIDSGVRLHSMVTMHYDPMVAKIIAWGETRNEALQRLRHALKNYHIGGIKTNLAFLYSVLNHDAFQQLRLSTDFLGREHLEKPQSSVHMALLHAISIDYLTAIALDDDLQKDTFAWQMHVKPCWQQCYLIQNTPYPVTIMPINREQMRVTINETTTELQVKLIEHQLWVDDGIRQQHVLFENLADKIILYCPLEPIVVQRFNWQTTSTAKAAEGSLTAPMPATIVAILKKTGDKISAGDTLMVLEAMKMEHTIKAPHAGVLSKIYYELGAQVNEGAALIALDKEEPSSS